MAVKWRSNQLIYNDDGKPCNKANLYLQNIPSRTYRRPTSTLPVLYQLHQFNKLYSFHQFHQFHRLSSAALNTAVAESVLLRDIWNLMLEIICHWLVPKISRTLSLALYTIYKLICCKICKLFLKYSNLNYS